MSQNYVKTQNRNFHWEKGKFNGIAPNLALGNSFRVKLTEVIEQKFRRKETMQPLSGYTVAC